MAEMRYTRVGYEISLVVEPINDSVMGLIVKENGLSVARFDVGMVWDFLKDALKEIQCPAQSVGLERRCYEASNIYKLTREWIEIKEKKEEFPDAHF